MSETLIPQDNIPITDRPLLVYANAFPVLHGLTGARVLDIGCGSSQIGYELRCRGNYYVGLDFQQEANGKTVQALAEDLPFRDDSFDYVLAFYSLPHWARSADQVTQFVKECGRVARQSILIAPDEPSEYVPGGWENMLAIDDAFKSSLESLRALGWCSIPSSYRLTQLHKR